VCMSVLELNKHVQACYNVEIGPWFYIAVSMVVTDVCAVEVDGRSSWRNGARRIQARKQTVLKREGAIAW
jgi:hypothetical protein